jgi:hypothetical protein
MESGGQGGRAAPWPPELASLPTKVIEEGGPSLVYCMVAVWWLYGGTKGPRRVQLSFEHDVPEVDDQGERPVVPDLGSAGSGGQGSTQW